MTVYLFPVSHILSVPLPAVTKMILMFSKWGIKLKLCHLDKLFAVSVDAIGLLCDTSSLLTLIIISVLLHCVAQLYS